MAGVKRDMQTLRALKQEGHDIIDALAKKGWSKNTVYRLLSEQENLGPHSVHFQNIFTVREAQKNVVALHKLQERLIRERREKRKARNEANKAREEARHVSGSETRPRTLWERIKSILGL